MSGRAGLSETQARMAAHDLQRIVGLVNRYREDYPTRPGLDDVALADEVSWLAEAGSVADVTTALVSILMAGRYLDESDDTTLGEWRGERVAELLGKLFVEV